MGCTSGDVAVLEGMLGCEHVAAGGVLFRRGDPGNAMYLVAGGQVALESTDAPPGRMLAVSGPGDWFGELALLTGATRTADARVLLDATLVRIDRAAWDEMGRRVPAVIGRICGHLAKQLVAASTPRRHARRTVVACDGADLAAGIAASIRTQFPGRALEVLPHGTALDRHGLGADATTAVVLLSSRDAIPGAEHRLERLDPTTWRLTSLTGPAVTGTVIRGSSENAALDRAARWVAGGRIGLALGAGGAFGYAHIGLLHALERAGVPVDVVAGASMGAIIGAGAAAGVPAMRLAEFARRAASRFGRVLRADLDLFGPAWLRGDAVMELLGELDELANATFASLQLPFVAVAMDLGSGAAVTLHEGPVLEGIRPSFAMPGIFAPIVRGEQVLVDGAMVNPVPVDAVRRLGADVVIAAQPIPALHPDTVDPVGRVLGGARSLARLLPIGGLRQSLEGLNASVRSFQALWHQLSNVTALGADVVVRPTLESFWFLQFGAAEEIIAAGDEAAMAAIPAIRAALADRVGWSPRA
ncbi:MAG TPA: cyclic nucleotide-binding and patatin-like phospholipase domain-containing protein [Candidatus Binatia bacterium]|jgi:NTE family protein|nr:cyclic nucleotide-binding and patatin-like phospholipase domain-containing protein [Candidatus Binatia bacterium]